MKGWSETGEAGTMSGVSYMCFRHWHASRTRFNIVLRPVRQTGPMVCPNICTGLRPTEKPPTMAYKSLLAARASVFKSNSLSKDVQNECEVGTYPCLSQTGVS